MNYSDSDGLITCITCDKRQYTFYMLDKYGREAVEQLKDLGRKVVSPTQKRLLAENAITYYTEAVKSL